ncbi:MAG: N-acetylmuramoyl-L-alanine amidase [Bacteriovoracaceae bacterium]|nr:N-acetylmuramoyl-L-alanine amidase [Bacteriovoracaceae bacterium]
MILKICYIIALVAFSANTLAETAPLRGNLTLIRTLNEIDPPLEELAPKVLKHFGDINKATNPPGFDGICLEIARTIDIGNLCDAYRFDRVIEPAPNIYTIVSPSSWSYEKARSYISECRANNEQFHIVPRLNHSCKQGYQEHYDVKIDDEKNYQVRGWFACPPKKEACNTINMTEDDKLIIKLKTMKEIYKLMKYQKSCGFKFSKIYPKPPNINFVLSRLENEIKILVKNSKRKLADCNLPLVIPHEITELAKREMSRGIISLKWYKMNLKTKLKTSHLEKLKVPGFPVSITIHHTGGMLQSRSGDAPIAIQRDHQQRGDDDIPYHYIVGINDYGKCQTFEGRSLSMVGAHGGSGLNMGTIAIAISGNYSPKNPTNISGYLANSKEYQRQPPASCIQQLMELISYLKSKFGSITNIYGHTSHQVIRGGCSKKRICPAYGKQLFMKALRDRFDNK